MLVSGRVVRSPRLLDYFRRWKWALETLVPNILWPGDPLNSHDRTTAVRAFTNSVFCEAFLFEKIMHHVFRVAKCHILTPSRAPEQNRQVHYSSQQSKYLQPEILCVTWNQLNSFNHLNCLGHFERIPYSHHLVHVLVNSTLFPFRHLVLLWKLTKMLSRMNVTTLKDHGNKRGPFTPSGTWTTVYQSRGQVANHRDANLHGEMFPHIRQDQKKLPNKSQVKNAWIPTIHS